MGKISNRILKTTNANIFRMKNIALNSGVIILIDETGDCEKAKDTAKKILNRIDKEKSEFLPLICFCKRDSLSELTIMNLPEFTERSTDMVKRAFASESPIAEDFNNPITAKEKMSLIAMIMANHILSDGFDGGYDFLKRSGAIEMEKEYFIRY